MYRKSRAFKDAVTAVADDDRGIAEPLPEGGCEIDYVLCLLAAVMATTIARCSPDSSSRARMAARRGRVDTSYRE